MSPANIPLQGQVVAFAQPLETAVQSDQQSAAQTLIQQQLPQLNNLYKTQLCKHFLQTKHCHVGTKCHFAHGENELRKKDDPLPVDVQMKMLNIPYNNYKTQKCKFFYEAENPGQCKFGKNCSYAHGEVDMRDPYQNVDIQELVKDHYGIMGYDPNSVIPSQSAKVNETGGTKGNSSLNSQVSAPIVANSHGFPTPNLQKSVSLPVQQPPLQYVMVGKQQQPRYIPVQNQLASQLQRQSSHTTDQQPNHQPTLVGLGQQQPALYSQQIQTGQFFQQGLITMNGGQQVVLLPSQGNGMFIQQPQQTIIQYVPVPVPTHPQASAAFRQPIQQLIRMPMPQQTTYYQQPHTNLVAQVGPPQYVFNQASNFPGFSQQQHQQHRPIQSNQIQDVSSMLANLHINPQNQGPQQPNAWGPIKSGQTAVSSNGGSQSVGVSNANSSSNGFNYMLINPNEYSEDDLEGAAYADQTSSAAAAMHTTSSILGAAIFK